MVCLGSADITGRKARRVVKGREGRKFKMCYEVSYHSKDTELNPAAMQNACNTFVPSEGQGSWAIYILPPQSHGSRAAGGGVCWSHCTLHTAGLPRGWDGPWKEPAGTEPGCGLEDLRNLGRALTPSAKGHKCYTVNIK